MECLCVCASAFLASCRPNCFFVRARVYLASSSSSLNSLPSAFSSVFRRFTTPEAAPSIVKIEKSLRGYGLSSQSASPSSSSNTSVKTRPSLCETWFWNECQALLDKMMAISELPLGIFPSEEQKLESRDSVTVLQRTMLPGGSGSGLGSSMRSKKRLDSVGLSRKFSGMMMDKWANVQGRRKITNWIANP